jgi:hemerythrin
MAAIEWNDRDSVNVKVIDDQHKHFIGILNYLYERLEANDLLKIPEIIQSVLAYTDYHFKTEEDLFEKFHYEGAAEHIRAHRDLVAEVEAFIARKDDLVVIGYDLLDFLSNWLVVHLNDMDHKYTKCFNEHGLY